MIDLKKLLQTRVQQDCKTLYLSFLFILEDLVSEHKITEEEYSVRRKRVLDAGNQTIRSINQQIDELDIKLKQGE